MRLDASLYELHHLETLARRNHWICRVHPLVKLFLTVLYIVLVVSFQKYNILALAGMVLYPFVLFLLAELSFKEALWRLRVVLPLVCAVGLANPFLDQAVVQIGSTLLPAGIISMVTLMMKGVFAVLASYLLIATTTMEDICFCLQLLHVPKLLITQILLTYRYIFVLLKEANRMLQAYHLRAPGQKGVHVKAWGSLAGLLLLRSVDRADALYESMTLRGYAGDFSYRKEALSFRQVDVLYLIFWTAALLLLWKIPIFYVVGSLFV